MATSFPALRGKIGETEYFAAVLTFGEVAKLVEFVEEIDEWDDHTEPEGKAQRKLNVQRVEREMVPYLLNSADHFYSALTVEVRPPLDDIAGAAIPFEAIGTPFPGGVAFGNVILDGTQMLYALDGQHRLQSIKRAIRLNPSLARDQITVILVPFRSLKQSQLLFSDLNRFAKSPSKSINLLFSHRDPIVMVAKRLMGEVEFLRGRVELESTSLSKQTPYVITLSTLYEITRALLGSRHLDDEHTIADEVARQRPVWEYLVNVVPQWKLVADRAEHPAYLRPKFLPLYGVCQQAIGLATAATLAARSNEFAALDGFADFDWTISNGQWQGIVVQGRRVNNTSTTIRLLGAFLGFKLGTLPSPQDAHALCEAIRSRGERPPTELEVRAVALSGAGTPVSLASSGE